MDVAVTIKRVGDHFEFHAEKAVVKRKLYKAFKRGEKKLCRVHVPE